MNKIDYILLSRHFRGETTEAEIFQISSWRDSDYINRRYYERLLNLYLDERKLDVERSTSQEIHCWNTIVSKILTES